MNEMQVSGPPEAVAAFFAHAAGVPPATPSLLTDSPDSAAVVVGALVDGTIASFSFAGILPCPDELRATASPFRGDDATRDRLVAAYGHTNWYDWCVANWGTKWDVGGDAELLDLQPDCVRLRFDTAWGPPIEWTVGATRLHPEVTIRVEAFEPGCDLVGWWETRAGEVVAEGDDVEWAQALLAAWAEHDAAEQAEA
jgi:hypothetical protein